MRKAILGLWYIITNQPKFRVKYEDGTYSKPMVYKIAEVNAFVHDGEICIEIKY